MKKIELLAPAGDLEKLKIAVMYGADAVFIGGNKFSLRSRASNFTIEDIKEACLFAHAHNSKVHVTCNIIMHNNDLKGLIDYLKQLELSGVDAIIAADPFIVTTALKNTKLEVHISTQQTSLNSGAIKFWKNIGAKRVVLGRELSVEEIKEIKENTDIEIETFIHGGMCVSYSGRCMLSNNMTNRDANRGGCAHSCRWNYDLYSSDEKVNPSDKYFAMSSKDLCAVREVPALIDAKVDSLKIEGRMKSIHYIATVVKTYRMLIDEYYNNGKIASYEFYEEQIKKAENRLTSHGFLHGMTSISEQLYNLRSEQPTQEFVGIVTKYDKLNKIAYIEERNFFKADSVLEVFGPTIISQEIKLTEIFDEEGNSLDAARHPKQIIHFSCEIELSPYDMLRLKRI